MRGGRERERERMKVVVECTGWVREAGEKITAEGWKEMKAEDK